MSGGTKLVLEDPTDRGKTIPVDDDHPIPVTVFGTLELEPPVGGATSAKQDDELARLVLMDAKLPALNSGHIPVATLDVAVGPTNITIINNVPAGVAPANSAVEITPAGRDTLCIQVTGVYTGALSLQGTVDGTTWVTLGGSVFSNVASSAITATITSAATGIFLAGVSGFQKVRVTALAAVTGTAVVSLRACDGNSLLVLTNGNIQTVTTVSTVSAVASITTGVAASNLGKAEDAVAGSGDTGVAMLAKRNDNAATDQTDNTGDYSLPAVDIKGAAFVRPAPAITGAVLSNVASSATNVTLTAAAAGRRRAIIYNDSTAILYIKYGATASLTSYTVAVPALAAGVASFHVIDELYTGIVDGIWASANGNARVTVIT